MDANNRLLVFTALCILRTKYPSRSDLPICIATTAIISMYYCMNRTNYIPSAIRNGSICILLCSHVYVGIVLLKLISIFLDLFIRLNRTQIPVSFFFYKYTRICKNLMKIIFVRNRNKILDFSNKPHSPKGNDQSCVTVIYLIVVGFLNTKPILIFVLHCVFSDVFLFSKMIEHSIISLFSKSRSTETCSNRNYFDSFFYRNVRWWVFKHGHCAFKITKLS